MFAGISQQNMAKHMVRLRTSILGSWRFPIEITMVLIDSSDISNDVWLIEFQKKS